MKSWSAMMDGYDPTAWNVSGEALPPFYEVMIGVYEENGTKVKRYVYFDCKTFTWKRAKDGSKIMTLKESYNSLWFKKSDLPVIY